MGTSFTKLRSFFHKISIINAFSLLREMLYAGHVKLCWSVVLFTHAVFQLAVFRKPVSSRCILQRAKRWKSEGAKSGGWGRTLHPIVAVASLYCRLMCGLALSFRRRAWFSILFGLTLRFVLTPLMSGDIALNWMWHLCSRSPLTRFLHCPRRH